MSTTNTPVPIGAVERDTGIPKDTLRIWERRYGFPVPERNTQGERTYTSDQVGVLRLLKQLVDRGHRPSKVVGRSKPELLGLLADDQSEERVALDDETARVLDALRNQDVPALLGELRGLLLRHGLERFTIDHLAPLTRAVGDEWAAGRLAIHQEHLFSDQVDRLLAQAIGQQPAETGQRPVLLATLPGERHRLGLRMAEVILTVRGRRCVSIGADLPVDEIANACREHDADTVALSVTVNNATLATARAIADLQLAVPPGTAVWVGGRGAAMMRTLPKSVHTFDRLEALATALDQPRGD
jgi:methanogenic corrinoid protein MtbC1